MKPLNAIAGLIALAVLSLGASVTAQQALEVGSRLPALRCRMPKDA